MSTSSSSSARWIGHHPNAIMMVDVSQMGGITAEARKVVSDLNIHCRYRALVVCGDSLGMRAMIVSIARGLGLIGKLAIHTFKEVAAAREWLASLPPRQASAA